MIDAHGLGLPGLAAACSPLRQSPVRRPPGRCPGERPGPAVRPIRRLVFAGEALVDLVMRIPALPERGGDMIATSAGPAVGGGFNIMAAAARHGLPVLYAGGHGSGPWGDLVRSALAAEGIAVLRPPDRRPTPASTSPWWSAAASARSSPASARKPCASQAAGTPSRSGPVTPSTFPATGWPRPPRARSWGSGLPACRAGVLLFADPGPLIAEIPAAVLGPVRARCDWWSCNEREARASTGVADPAEAARRLLSQAGGADHGRRDSPAGGSSSGPGRRAACWRAATRSPTSRPRGSSRSTPPARVTPTPACSWPGWQAGWRRWTQPAGPTPPRPCPSPRPGPATSPARAELDAWLAARALPAWTNPGNGRGRIGGWPRSCCSPPPTPSCSPRARRARVTGPRTPRVPAGRAGGAREADRRGGYRRPPPARRPPGLA